MLTFSTIIPVFNVTAFLKSNVSKNCESYGQSYYSNYSTLATAEFLVLLTS